MNLLYYRLQCFSAKKEKEKLVIKLANEGKTTREIAKEVHVSPKTIQQILNKVTGDDEAEKEQRLKDKSEYARAFKMFKDGRRLEDVAIELDIESPLVKCHYEDYITLLNMGRLVTIYKELKGDLSMFLQLYARIKKEGLGKPQIAELLKTPDCLLDMKKKVDIYTSLIWDLHSKKVKMEKEIGMLSDVLI
jgi:IS30 family transposase